jgi:FkbM family methyltransferase
MSFFSSFKYLIKQSLWTLHIDVTRNMQYDRFAFRLIKSLLKDESNCIDIGCHKGEILDWMVRFAPKGTHHAVEPIPYLFNALKEKYTQSNIHLHALALSDNAGKLNFNVVKNAPAYSGIRQRKYAIQNPDVEIIEVEVQRLDDLIPNNQAVRLIKIDVEGAELDVLKGATRILKECRPYVMFEFGLGSAEFYNASPEAMFALMLENNMHLYSLKDWFSSRNNLSKEEFVNHFNNNSEYYFLAVPSELR